MPRVQARVPARPGTARTGPKEGIPADPEPANEVRIVGRLSVDPQVRTMPSGDEAVSFRLVVPRDGRVVDALDCIAWRADVRRWVMRARPGMWLEVHGSMRRRFWKGASGPVSRVEVEVASARRAP